MSLWTELRVKGLFRRARVAVARGDYDSALVALHRIYGLIGASPPSDSANPLHNLLLAKVCAAVDARSACLSACRVARRQFDEAIRGNQVDGESGKYLLYVCRAIAGSIANRSSAASVEARALARSIQIDYAKIDQARVPKWLKRWFPLTELYVNTIESILRANGQDDA